MLVQVMRLPGGRFCGFMYVVFLEVCKVMPDDLKCDQQKKMKIEI